VALAAVVATVTFAAGLTDLVSTPARYGQDWDLMVDGGFSPAPVTAIVTALGPDPAVAAIAGGRYGEVNIDGQRVPTVSLADVVGTTFPAVITGQATARGDELVLGQRSLRALGRSVGDTVTVDAGDRPREMRVVGTVAFPRLNHGSFSTLGLGEGALLPAGVLPPIDLAGAGSLPGREADYLGPSGDSYEFVTVRLRSAATAADRARVTARLNRLLNAHYYTQLRVDQRPTAIDNYASIRATPAFLALVLGAMAAATLLHLEISVVRRRRRDLALCGALGMTRGQLLRAVVVQSLVVTGTAFLVGLPVGVAAGRVAWSRFASDLGVVDALRVPVGTLAPAVPLVAALAAVIALVPALVGARRRTAVTLRSE
jgi:hypothetical protein